MVKVVGLEYDLVKVRQSEWIGKESEKMAIANGLPAAFYDSKHLLVP